MPAPVRSTGGPITPVLPGLGASKAAAPGDPTRFYEEPTLGRRKGRLAKAPERRPNNRQDVRRARPQAGDGGTAAANVDGEALRAAGQAETAQPATPSAPRRRTGMATPKPRRRRGGPGPAAPPVAGRCKGTPPPFPSRARRSRRQPSRWVWPAGSQAPRRIVNRWGGRPIQRPPAPVTPSPAVTPPSRRAAFRDRRPAVGGPR